MQVSPSVRAVQVPDANPMHPDFTTIYLVGKGQTLSIDSGETMDRYRWMLKGYLAAVEKTEIALAGITHHHGDHSGNLKWVREELHAEIVTAKDAVPLLKGRLPRTGVRTFAPDTVIDLDGGINVRVIKTPGHSTDSICYYIENEGVLFSGDTSKKHGQQRPVARGRREAIRKRKRSRLLPELRNRPGRPCRRGGGIHPRSRLRPGRRNP